MSHLMTLGPARYGATREAIIEMIRNSLSSGGEKGKEENREPSNKLPPEGELAYRFGVSTATVREALRMLEREGTVSKKHGVGNFFHPSALDLPMRIDLISDFTELLIDAGYSAEEYSNTHCYRPPSEREREVFSLNEELYSYDRIYTADGENAIFTRNLIPKSLFTSTPEEDEPNLSIMEFARRFCRERITHSIQELEPRGATEEEQRLFGIDAGTSLITCSETFYSYRDLPIGYAWDSFHPGLIKMHLLRKWS